MSLFVDSSAWFAAVDRGDRDHARAKAVLGRREHLVTTDHVLVESWALMRVRLHRAAAGLFWKRMRAGIAQLEFVTAADVESAWLIREGFPDQDFSIVDLTSFATMHRLKLTRVASFDEHFAIYRYGRNRRNALEVVR